MFFEAVSEAARSCTIKKCMYIYSFALGDACLFIAAITATWYILLLLSSI